MERNARTPAVAGTIEQELLRLLARQGTRVPVPVFLAAVLIASIAAPYVPTAAWVLWLALVACVLTVRWVVLGRLPGWNGYSEQRRLHIAVLLSAANGSTHALSLAFFPELSGFERAIQSFLLIGLCAGSVATTAGYRPVFVAYLLPTLGTLTVLWAVLPVADSRGWWVNESVALVTALFGMVLLALAKDAHRLFRESFEIRLQQAALNRQLQAALELAESASRAKTRFLASASHDLRQPVHTLSLFAAALEMRPLDDRSREISSHINTALEVLAAQLDSLLDISKLDAGVVQAMPEPVALGRLLDRIREECAPDARRKGLALAVDCPPDLRARTDPVLFERIVRNLVGNAIKYTQAGDVRVEAYLQAQQVVLTVSDTGPGIAAAEQARVFEEFYQLENPERDRTKGLGLGLAIVRRLVDLLGIRMEMVSQPGAGTQFFLLLPECAEAAAARPPSAPVTLPPAIIHVLVVDDEAAIREGMRILLEGMGARVCLADSSAGALALARDTRPDLVLADLRLRGGDSGIRAVQEVRSLYPDAAAVLISGDTAPDRLQEAEDAGILLLHKPVPAELLKRVIAEAVQQSGESAIA
ncbi:MAG TPA: hybrid sensor histidine kinase/response regulator [Noviherbaspirillum sp.]|jgi:signal transduction histidine kinase|uniref:hybrid sensor histidine kinase/response regulator n=1 Tax=Noviherbaspirillum sp. TaxID=1926288 RepID=UPI002F95B490